MAKSAQPQPIKESCRGRACGPVSLVPRMTVKERCWISVSSQLFTQMEALSFGDGGIGNFQPVLNKFPTPALNQRFSVKKLAYLNPFYSENFQAYTEVEKMA